MNAVIRLMAQHGINTKASQLKAEEQLDLSFCKRFEEQRFFQKPVLKSGVVEWWNDGD